MNIVERSYEALCRNLPKSSAEDYESILGRSPGAFWRGLQCYRDLLKISNATSRNVSTRSPKTFRRGFIDHSKIRPMKQRDLSPESTILFQSEEAFCRCIQKRSGEVFRYILERVPESRSPEASSHRKLRWKEISRSILKRSP